ncbi:MAG: Crp/Fnr family transcriptional regulator [Cytophagaceae bacterium]|jgi:CRP-like cAMP-binding protein|nr:Crp/Fnr family transcriptional regulator [Cytophagaceae bacterium]
MNKQDTLPKLKDFFDRNIPLPEPALIRLFEAMELVKLPSKHSITQPGEICTIEAYILKGIARTYFINEQGDEVTVHFAKEDWWIGDVASFTLQRPSLLHIETLEETYMLTISYERKEQLYAEYPIFERIFRLMIQRTHAFLMNRLVSVLSESADKRYQYFLDRYPDVPQRVPQHYIASYLGISPEFLSKIRSKKAKLRS